MQEYIDLLEANYNLILTGAPGTGKTYLAREIAKAMNAEVEFVQFHPSYDYTDFVEGLRPVKNENEKEIGFQLQDGIFKDFCKKARNSLQSQEKDEKEIEDEIKEQTQNQHNELSIEEQFDLFIEYISKEIREGREFYLHGVHGESNTPIVKINKDTFVVKIKNEYHVSLKDSITHYKEFLKNRNINWTADEVNKIFKVSGMPTYHMGFIRAFDEFVQKSKSNDQYKNDIVNTKKTKTKKFVFIIDEINRAEISKVFGELFFALDPGYRGNKDHLSFPKTQYSNLHDEDDPFKNGFYIPENVYIIGTMNNIDRSVESFDFAMRRRFAWKEVHAPSSKNFEMPKMWVDLLKKEEAFKRIVSLNNEIAQTDGLGKDFQIGPSYFKHLPKYNYNFDTLWTLHLEGLLSEYVRGLPEEKELLMKLKDAYNLKETSDVYNN